ncbi:MAG: hypothetical protein ACP5NZ_02575 [Nanobdellota archaeon]
MTTDYYRETFTLVVLITILLFEESILYNNQIIELFKGRTNILRRKSDKDKFYMIKGYIFTI